MTDNIEAVHHKYPHTIQAFLCVDIPNSRHLMMELLSLFFWKARKLRYLEAQPLSCKIKECPPPLPPPPTHLLLVNLARVVKNKGTKEIVSWKHQLISISAKKFSRLRRKLCKMWSLLSPEPIVCFDPRGGRARNVVSAQTMAVFLVCAVFLSLSRCFEVAYGEKTNKGLFSNESYYNYFLNQAQNNNSPPSSIAWLTHFRLSCCLMLARVRCKEVPSDSRCSL